MFRLDLAAFLTFTASHAFFRRIELYHVALPVESDLPMSIVSSGPLMDMSAYKKTNLHAGWPAFFLSA